MKITKTSYISLKQEKTNYWGEECPCCGEQVLFPCTTIRYYVCPNCGKKIKIDGLGNSSMKLKFIGKNGLMDEIKTKD